MPPVAQMLMLFHIEKGSIEGLNTSEIAELTGMAYPTFNVALRWLVTKNIIALEGSKQKHVQITVSREELLNKLLPLMSSPIERVLFADTRLNEDGFVDRLSLYLSLKDNQDERIQLECDTMIKEIDLFNTAFLK